MEEKTVYGIKKQGRSNFVVIAPHASGDDLKSGVIARKLAKKLNASLVINKNFRKYKRVNSADNREIEDFNKLCWSFTKNKYLWGRKNPAMKIFFDDIANFAKTAKEKTKAPKAVNIYIHSFRSEKVGIDLGVGLRPGKFKKKLFGSRRHFSIGNNSGEVTMKIRDLKKMKNSLEEKLLVDYNLSVTVGENYSGWSRQSAIQFHKCANQNDFAIQLEISQSLRKSSADIEYLVDLLKKVFLNIFNN